MDLCEGTLCSGQRHPWELVRRNLFRRVLALAGLPPRPLRLLDLGAGDGWLARELFPALNPESAVWCCDANYTDTMLDELAATAPPRFRYCRETPSGEFDVILMLDVLEHIADDAGFLAETVARRLAGSGILLCSVPAHSWLFSAHDRQLGHYRRYAPRQARCLLRGAGLKPMLEGGLFPSLLPIRAMRLTLESAGWLHHPPATAAGWHHGPAITGMVTTALNTDAAICLAASRISLSLPGLSWWACCRKNPA